MCVWEEGHCTSEVQCKTSKKTPKQNRLLCKFSAWEGKSGSPAPTAKCVVPTPYHFFYEIWKAEEWAEISERKLYLYPN